MNENQIDPEDILSQWKEFHNERDKEIQERANNVFMPKMGIEESVMHTSDDVHTLFWFVDKCLKMLSQIKATDSQP